MFEFSNIIFIDELISEKAIIKLQILHFEVFQLLWSERYLSFTKSTCLFCINDFKCSLKVVLKNRKVMNFHKFGPVNTWLSFLWEHKIAD